MQAGTTVTLTPQGRPELRPASFSAPLEIRIGRSSRCDVLLPPDARGVSRVHAVMAYRQGQWFLTDTSRRGTFLEGQRLTPGIATPVPAGSHVFFGEYEFVVSEGGASSDPFGPDGAYAVSECNVDLASIDSARILHAALELPEVMGAADTECAIYHAACEYLVDALAPVVATAYVIAAHEQGPVDILSQAERPEPENVRRTILEPLISRRVAGRLMRAKESVLFLQRQRDDATLGATVTQDTHMLGACLLDVDRHERTTVLYVVGDRHLASGDNLVPQYLRLVATLVRQRILTVRRAHLAKYFSPKVVSMLVDRAGMDELEGPPRVVEATSLFFDVRGSSLPLDASAEDLEMVYHALREIIGIVTDAVFECDGTVIDYAGDGVFAAWGVPVEQPNHAQLAVACATTVAGRLRHLDFPGLGPSRSLFGIGIACGQVLAGSIGSRAVFKYGILGPSVSAACRLADLTKHERLNSPVLLSNDVHAALTPGRFITRPLGARALVGLGASIEVHELLRSADAREARHDVP